MFGKKRMTKGQYLREKYRQARNESPFKIKESRMKKRKRSRAFKRFIKRRNDV